SRELSAPGWGRGRSASERESARPSPESRRLPSRRSAGPEAAAPAMEPDNSPRKIQFTVPLLEPHLDPEAAEQIRRRRPTPATLVLTSDQSSPEVDEDRLPNPLLKSTLAMSPRQRKKVTRTTPTMKELQTMVEHHLGQQQQGEEPEGAAESTGTQESCPPGIPGAESRLGTPGTAQSPHKYRFSLLAPTTPFPSLEPAEPIPKTQEKGSEEPSTEECSSHIPPLDSQGANSVRPRARLPSTQEGRG
ncbi:Protein phosphatase 1 regulatory subunit 1A, partial [Galemys pyrenaicus]